MTTACIVQARLGSSRLPAKVLLPLPTGRTVLEEVLLRCKQIPGIDVVVCAIPDTAENDIVQHHLFHQAFNAYGMPWFVTRGPEHDVLARYAKAAEAVNADVIMRITADCPLIDPDACGKVLSRWMLQSRICIGVNTDPRTWPHGFDCEVFSRDALDHANNKVAPHPGPGPYQPSIAYDLRTGQELGVADTPQMFQRAADDREHVTPFLRRNLPIMNITSEGEDRSHLRWTLDTLEDYVRIWGIFQQQMREAA